MSKYNSKTTQVATLSINTPNVDDIASTMNITKLAVLGAFAPLKKDGLATYENGSIALTTEGLKEFEPVDEVLNEIADLLSQVGVTASVKIKEGSRKATCHEVYTNNPGATKAALNKLLQAATGLERRPCYVIQGNYEKAVGIK